MKIDQNDTFGPFKIEKAISKGGMSHIFLASLTARPTYKVVLKFNASSQTTFQDLLRREADILKTLHHPSIVRIYPMRFNKKRIVYQARANALENSPWYFAMEYLAGGGLNDLMPTINQLLLLWRIELFYQLLIVIHDLHKNGVSHCDLKPDNILFRTPPQPHHAPQPVLIDFGSVVTNCQRTRLDFTPSYSPPELIAANLSEADSSLRHPDKLPPKKADIWALGAILYELLTGQPLVTETEPKAIAKRIQARSWDAIQTVNPSVHKSFDLLLNQLLNPDPHKRPSTAQLIEAIQERIQTAMPPRLPFNMAQAESLQPLAHNAQSLFKRKVI